MKCEDDLLCGVNKVTDLEHMSGIEKEHVPIITAPAEIRANEPFDVTIEVGEQMSHPSEPIHYVDFIDLYADDTFIARLDLTPKTTLPVMTKVCIVHKMTIEANLGGIRSLSHCLELTNSLKI